MPTQDDLNKVLDTPKDPEKWYDSYDLIPRPYKPEVVGNEVAGKEKVGFSEFSENPYIESANLEGGSAVLLVTEQAAFVGRISPNATPQQTTDKAKEFRNLAHELFGEHKLKIEMRTYAAVYVIIPVVQKSDGTRDFADIDGAKNLMDATSDFLKGKTDLNMVCPYLVPEHSGQRYGVVTIEEKEKPTPPLVNIIVRNQRNQYGVQPLPIMRPPRKSGIGIGSVTHPFFP